MKNIKELENKSIEELLNYTNVMKRDSLEYYCNNNMIVDSKYEEYEKLEKKVYQLAIEKATTQEELEKCAKQIEENYTGDDIDPDEWAEQIRIKAYGIEWYLNQFFKSPQYDEFIRFTEKEDIVNPLNGLHQIVNSTKVEQRGDNYEN